ncbi:hypothetical protein DFH09DRAFT_1273650 [Mycena vulgaris]|nr:hypothetical protein DFH09DRAFT_1273650 [Mycena vulgaris]
MEAAVVGGGVVVVVIFVISWQGKCRDEDAGATGCRGKGAWCDLVPRTAVRLSVFACGPRGKRHRGGESEGRGKGCGGDEASAGGSLVRPDSADPRLSIQTPDACVRTRLGPESFFQLAAGGGETENEYRAPDAGATGARGKGAWDGLVPRIQRLNSWRRHPSRSRARQVQSADSSVVSRERRGVDRRMLVINVVSMEDGIERDDARAE